MRRAEEARPAWMMLAERRRCSAAPREERGCAWQACAMSRKDRSRPPATAPHRTGGHHRSGGPGHNCTCLHIGRCTMADTSMMITLALAAYVGVSLTIPLWVPIVKQLTGDCGLFWVRVRT